MSIAEREREGVHGCGLAILDEDGIEYRLGGHLQ